MVREIRQCWQAHERPVGDSWRVDETYLKVRGRWVYLYRAVDKQGKTVESYLSRTRDITAAKAFFRKAFRRQSDPRVITLDGFEPTHAALRRLGMNNEFNYCWDGAVQIRNCPYLNNVVEQDHRRVKSRVSPMLGFKRFLELDTAAIRPIFAQSWYRLLFMKRLWIRPWRMTCIFCPRSRLPILCPDRFESLTRCDVPAKRWLLR
jgi:transposase-like protein